MVPTRLICEVVGADAGPSQDMGGVLRDGTCLTALGMNNALSGIALAVGG